MNKGALLLSRFFQSQTDVAPRLGISASFLSLLLKGDRLPSIEVAAAIEREFGVPCRTWTENVSEPPKIIVDTSKTLEPIVDTSETLARINVE